jgi:hypothetical protein
MSIEVYNLYQVDFDNFENTVELSKKLLASFYTGREGTAHFKCSEFISKITMPQFYLGWNGEIYPKFEITRSYAN